MVNGGVAAAAPPSCVVSRSLFVKCGCFCVPLTDASAMLFSVAGRPSCILVLVIRGCGAATSFGRVEGVGRTLLLLLLLVLLLLVVSGTGWTIGAATASSAAVAPPSSRARPARRVKCLLNKAWRSFWFVL